MRHAFPLIHCVDEDTRAKLLGRVTNVDKIPDSEWAEWGSDKKPRSFSPGTAEVDYDKFMRQAPSRSRGKGD